MVLASIKDVADLAGSLAWPVVALILALGFRPALSRALERGTLQKVGIGPVSLEFAAASAYQPTSQAAPLIDASAGPAIPSAVPSIVSELEGPAVDYVLIDLGSGTRWLTSRLYIFGQLVRRMRGARAFVFVRSVNPERVFLGSADIETTLWLLAERYPHLECAFAGAYGRWWSQAINYPEVPPGQPQPYAILSPTGRLPAQAVTAISMDFVNSLQRPVAPATSGWVPLGEDDGGGVQAWEHGQWLSAGAIDRLLGDSLNSSRVDRSTTTGADAQVRAVIAQQGEFVAMVDADQRFERLIDRIKLVDAVARGCAGTLAADAPSRTAARSD